MKKIFETKQLENLWVTTEERNLWIGNTTTLVSGNGRIFFSPHLDLLLVPEPAGFKSDETWEICFFFSAKNAVKLCSTVYEFTTPFLELNFNFSSQNQWIDFKLRFVSPRLWWSSPSFQPLLVSETSRGLNLQVTMSTQIIPQNTISRL